MKSISVIIPTYNGNELLEKYLFSVAEACKNYSGEWEIIVVEDGGDSPLPLLSRSGLEEVKYIRREQNNGFSCAMNTGIHSAKGKIIISLNNDVKVTPNFLLPLLKYFDDPSVFSVKPKSILPDGSNESIKVIQINKGMVESLTYNDEITLNPPLQKGGRGILELVYSCAGSAAYDKNKLLELGGFDEIYSPFYWEDFDLGYRAVKRGWKNIYEPQSVVYHEHGATISKTTKVGPSGSPSGQSPPSLKLWRAKQSIFIRNREIFYWKNIHDISLNFTALFSFPVRFIKAILLGKKDISQGLLLFLKLLPVVMKKRLEEKNTSKIKDREIIKKFSSNKN